MNGPAWTEGEKEKNRKIDTESVFLLTKVEFGNIMKI